MKLEREAEVAQVGVVTEAVRWAPLLDEILDASSAGRAVRPSDNAAGSS